MVQLANLTSEPTYQEELQNNEQIFKEFVRRGRPDIYVLMELLDQTGVNSNVLLKVIRQIHELAVGTGYGKVTVEMENKTVTFVDGLERDRLQEPALIKKP